MNTGNLNGQGIAELQNYRFQNLQSAPTTDLGAGRYYFSTTDNTLYVYNGSTWVNALVQGSTYSEGDGIDITSNTISIDLATGVNAGNVTLTTTNGLAANVAEASTNAKGIIEIATDTEASTGTATDLAVTPKQLGTKVTANNAITGATKCKITYDAKGLVTAGADLTTSDIPDLSGTYISTSLLGANSGVATLGADGKVPSSQLPSYVDDVIETYIVSGATALSVGWLSETSGGNALTPEEGIIYVVLTSGEYQNKTYRWAGTTYVEISSAPGQATESTAGIAELATQTEVTTGTNDTKIVTPLKLATRLSGMVKSYSEQNSSLTQSGGLCTWAVTHNLNSSNVEVNIYNVSTGKKVLYDYSITSANVVTVEILSASDIATDTYRIVVQG